MEYQKSDTEEDDFDAKYYSSIYYVDKMTIENPVESSAALNFDVDDLTKRVISKRYWSTPEPQNTPTQKSKLQNKTKDISNKHDNHVSEKSSKVQNLGKNSQILKKNQNEYKNIQKGNSRNTWDLPKSSENIPDKNAKTPKKNSVAECMIQNPKINSTSIADDEQSNDKEIPTKNSAKTKSISDSSIINFNSQDSGDKPRSPLILNNDQTKKSKGKTKSRNSKNTINTGVITLESSDDESVIAIEPPCAEPTICIDSSDDDTVNSKKHKKQLCPPPHANKSSKISTPSQNKCASPVLSVVSSTSDDFISTDCSILNISSKENDQHMVFNFQLHGSDLAEGISVFNNSSKKNKQSLTSGTDCNFKSSGIEKILKTQSSPSLTMNALNDAQMFATPKSKGKKNLNSKGKSYTINEENFTPFTDIYESESSDFPDSVVDVPISSTPLSRNMKRNLQSCNKIVNTVSIEEDTMIMANVVGLVNPKIGKNISKNEDTTIDLESNINNQINDVIKNANEKSTFNKCIKDMNKFYNESWGGEHFDHAKIQNKMPHSKELWSVDLADKLLYKHKRKEVCLLCNKFGHKEEKCMLKKSKCLMCGSEGHSQNRCPAGICLTCGCKQKLGFSAKCVNCSHWKTMKCSTCNGFGHPKNSCPDLWKRYHLTLKNEIPLIEDKSKRVWSSIFCSGCAQRGHTVNTCKIYKPRYNLSSPFVHNYTPVYIPDGVRTSNINSLDILKSSSRDKTVAIEPIAAPYKESPAHSDREIKCVPVPKRKLEIEKKICDQISPKKIKTTNDCNENPINNQMGTSLVLLSFDQIQKLAKSDSAAFLEHLSMKYKLRYKQQLTVLGHSMFIDGMFSNQVAFWVEFNNFFNNPIMFHNTSLEVFMSENKFETIKMLTQKLNGLKKSSCETTSLQNLLLNFKNQFNNLTKMNKYNDLKEMSLINKVSKNINKVSKQLNTILIGKMGLCGGRETLNKLHENIKYLNNQNSNTVTLDQREQLCVLYLTIFSSIPREDYRELFLLFNDKPVLKKKKKNKVLKRLLKNPFKGLNPRAPSKTILNALILTQATLAKSPNIESIAVRETFKNLNHFEKQLKNNEFSDASFRAVKNVANNVFQNMRNHILNSL